MEQAAYEAEKRRRKMRYHAAGSILDGAREANMRQYSCAMHVYVMAQNYLRALYSSPDRMHEHWLDVAKKEAM